MPACPTWVAPVRRRRVHTGIPSRTQLPRQKLGLVEPAAPAPPPVWGRLRSRREAPARRLEGLLQKPARGATSSSRRPVSEWDEVAEGARVGAEAGCRGPGRWRVATRQARVRCNQIGPATTWTSLAGVPVDTAPAPRTHATGRGDVQSSAAASAYRWKKGVRQHRADRRHPKSLPWWRAPDHAPGRPTARAVPPYTLRGRALCGGCWR